ncbi:MAG: hypothetical protein QM648_03665 [Solirubrobacterales bacterium]
MIASLTGLFLERERIMEGRPQLTSATRLLVVDACAEARRLRCLLEQLEASAPVTVGLADLASLSCVADGAGYDRVWLVLDAGSDPAYCAVIESELRVRFAAARVEVVVVGECDGAEAAFRLSPEQVGSAPPWRRGRELARGAACAATFLGGGS